MTVMRFGEDALEGAPSIGAHGGISVAPRTLARRQLGQRPDHQLSSPAHRRGDEIGDRVGVLDGPDHLFLASLENIVPKLALPEINAALSVVAPHSSPNGK
jgi:hypothetical protein